MNGAKLSEADRTRLRASFERVPLLHLLDLKLDRIERGAATLHAEVREELTQNYGLLARRRHCLAD
ncbi:MAG: hypothetical protein ABR577_09140 [Pyrinomonadaceae bacterium]